MSKKSRRRNKKILGVLGALGAAALLGKHKRTRATDAASDAKAAAVKKMTQNDAYSPTVVANAPIRKDVMPAPAVAAAKTNWISPRMEGHGDQSGAVGQKIRADYAQKNRYVNPNEQTLAAGNAYVPRVSRVHVKRGNKDGGRIGAKHGGRVTGIAKRGISPILLKGKK
jgi:hypothetical protein